MRKNISGQFVAFQAVSTTDGSAVTTGTPAVYYTIDGGTEGTGGGACVHEGHGTWSYACAQAETNGNHVVFTFVLTGAVSQTVNVYPVGYDETAANVPAAVNTIANDAITAAAIANGAIDAATFAADALAAINAEVDSALNTAIPGSPTANSINERIATMDGLLLGTIAAGTHSPQSGDAYARLGAPAGASHAADVAEVKSDTAAVKAKTDNLPTDPADQSAVEAAITAATSGLATASALTTIDTLLDKFAPLLIGDVSGAGTGTEVFVYGGVTATVTVDGDGNRSLAWS